MSSGRRDAIEEAIFDAIGLAQASTTALKDLQAKI